VQVAFRLAEATFASSVAEMLSGEGAWMLGGRWNNRGTRVVYLSESVALGALELLVHIRVTGVLAGYRTLRVEIPTANILDVNPADLPADWNALVGSTGARAIGDAWVASKASLALRVPSAVVPQESNFLLNPEHADFPDVRHGAIEPFSYDPRLLAPPGKSP
jgi:RES domain-containing protein